MAVKGEKREAGIRAKSGSSNGACEGWLAEGNDSLLASGTCLVKDAAIVGRDIVGVEEEAFLH